jgi:hypothetical protein
MHDTAYQIGTLAMNIYADLASASVLEIGSHAVNGSLRDNVLPTTNYFGVDIEEGEGVDLVVEPGKPLPIEDNSYDLVMATSVFEHDPFFWLTFLEMCRTAKDGAYIYVNAPSNGVVHRYPQDNWRFYPDAGRALASWATSQGVPVAVIESFIAGRNDDIWNDFVAVFRKGPIKKKLPSVFIHEHVRCTDVITWKSNEILNPSAEPEDMLLFREANDRARAANEKLEELRDERVSLNNQLDELHSRIVSLEGLEGEVQELKSGLRLRENELAQRQEEIEQTRLTLARARAEFDSLEVQLAASKHEAEVEWSERKKAEDRCADLQRQLEAARSTLQQARAANAEIGLRLDERFRELAVLSDLLAKREGALQALREEADWLREIGTVVVNGSNSMKSRLLGLLPANYQTKRQRRLLKRKGLFDSEAYLSANQDVAADKSDPLAHYLRHGLAENRPRG